MGVGRDFSRGGSRGFSQIFFQGGQKCWNLFFTPINWRNNLFLLIISKSRGAKAPLLPLPTAMPIYMWHEQAIIEWLRCSISAMLAGERLNKITSVREEWLRRLISIVTCCHSVKLCLLATRASDRNKIVLWPGCERSCQVRRLYKNNVRSVRFVVKRRDVVATSRLALRWMCDSPRTGCARIGPALASAGPNSKHRRGAPLSNGAMSSYVIMLSQPWNDLFNEHVLAQYLH